MSDDKGQHDGERHDQANEERPDDSGGTAGDVLRSAAEGAGETLSGTGGPRETRTAGEADALGNPPGQTGKADSLALDDDNAQR